MKYHLLEIGRWLKNGRNKHAQNIKYNRINSIEKGVFSREAKIKFVFFRQEDSVNFKLLSQLKILNEYIHLPGL